MRSMSCEIILWELFEREKTNLETQTRNEGCEKLFSVVNRTLILSRGMDIVWGKFKNLKDILYSYRKSLNKILDTLYSLLLLSRSIFDAWCF